MRVSFCLVVGVAFGACHFHAPAADDMSGDDVAPGDARIDADPNDPDPDHDGVVTGIDNCPLTANPDQHDEDGDGIGDACDPCPQLANTTGDTDGDGIDDACDPHPTVMGDKLVAFEGFGTPGIPAGWTVVGGVASDWGVVADALELDVQDAAHFLLFDAGSAHATIEMGVELENLFGATTPAVSAIFTVAPSQANYYLCSIFATNLAPDATPERKLQHFTGSFASLGAGDTTEPPTLPSAFRIIGTIDAAGQLCTTPAIPPTATSHVLAAQDTSNGGQSIVGIRIRNQRVKIAYLAVYRAP